MFEANLKQCMLGEMHFGKVHKYFGYINIIHT